MSATPKPLWVCPRCGRRFVRPRQAHSCRVRSVDDHFRGKDPRLRSLFDELLRALQRTGPLRVDAVDTTIHLVSGHHFGGIGVRRDYLRLEFLANREIQDKRIESVERVGLHRVAHHVIIRARRDLDATLLGWLSQAQAMQARSGTAGARRTRRRATPTTVSPQPDLALRIVIERPVPGVTLRLQRGRKDLVEPTSATPSLVTFDFTVRIGPLRDGKAPNFLGPLAQGPPAARFVYVNAGKQAGQTDTPWDRRAKIPLASITQAQVKATLAAPDARLEVRIPGRGRDGGPTCATVPLAEGAWQVRRLISES